MARHQVNFSLETSEHEALRVAAFLKGSTPTQYCREVVVDRLRAMAEDPLFQQAAEARGLYLDRQGADVVEFRRPRTDNEGDA